MKTFSKKILLSLVLFSIVLVPLIVSAEPIEIPNPLEYDTLVELIEAITNFIFTLALVAAPLVFLIGGFVFLTSGGDANKIKQGKDIMVYAAIGFAIILSIKGLVGLIKQVLGVEEQNVFFQIPFFFSIIKLKEIKRSILKNISER
jgi:surface polysaccharide O-acyltransferase-like enzyme